MKPLSLTWQHFFWFGSAARAAAGLYSVSSAHLNAVPGLLMGLTSLQCATCMCM
jgi:hypothetical protein